MRDDLEKKEELPVVARLVVDKPEFRLSLSSSGSSGSSGEASGD